MSNERNPHEYFDERQVQIRNRIGNQSFLMLSFLLMLNLVLPDYGVKWAGGEIGVTIILLSCVGYYLTRLAFAGAYAKHGSGSTKPLYALVSLVAAVSLIIAIAKKTDFFHKNLNISIGGVSRLFLFYLVFFMVIIVSRAISKHMNDKGNE